MSSQTVKYLVQASLIHHLLASVLDPLFTSNREINLAEFSSPLPLSIFFLTKTVQSRQYNN